MPRPLLLLATLVSACSGSTEPPYVPPTYADAAGIWKLQVSDTAGCNSPAVPPFAITLRVVPGAHPVDSNFFNSFTYAVPDSATWSAGAKSGYLTGTVYRAPGYFWLQLGTGPYNGGTNPDDTTARAELRAENYIPDTLAGTLADPVTWYGQAHHPIFASDSCVFRVRGSRIAHFRSADMAM